MSRSGAIGGLLLGLAVDFVRIIESSPADSIGTTSLVVTVLFFVGVGAVFGEKIIDNLFAWASWL
jgi:hypothetical protein